MPTGYTAEIKKGITFQQFAMNCARAFGACVTMREEPSDNSIPERFVPNDWHSTQLEKSRAELILLEGLSEVAAERAAASAWDEAETTRTIRLQEIAKQREKYEAMISQAQRWEPPTANHVGLREFMIEQISSTIKFDCDSDYYSTPTVRLSGPLWLAQQQAAAMRDIAYHEREHAAEVKRAEDRTAWVQALRASLT